MTQTRKTATISLSEVRAMCEREAVVELRPALRIFGISEPTGYRMAKYCPDQLPFKVLRVGSRYKVPTASLLAALDIPAADADRQLTA
ncbi:hypothetical protein [Gordonia aquimaris]|uniref:Uncharacterized protein n=1 Tax=Gordonia aquimaris TaxID=2984863 RepID=A0A9X3I5A9_9ACTN|nr:hypothetical protein [Gordonia aquimaris]MCX2965593.1 hypothetical protein [Gordonia aquimaris]